MSLIEVVDVASAISIFSVLWSLIGVVDTAYTYLCLSHLHQEQEIQSAALSKIGLAALSEFRLAGESVIVLAALMELEMETGWGRLMDSLWAKLSEIGWSLDCRLERMMALFIQN